jgi:hypothetical protein
MASDGYYQIDFLLPTNQDWNDSFQIGANTGEDGAFEPTDLTGYTFQMHIRRQVDDLDTLMILNTANTRIGISGDASDGAIAIQVPDEEVQRITPGVYFHDIVMFDADGDPRRIAKGTVTVERGVTRV